MKIDSLKKQEWLNKQYATVTDQSLKSRRVTKTSQYSGRSHEQKLVETELGTHEKVLFFGKKNTVHPKKQ